MTVATFHSLATQGFNLLQDALAPFVEAQLKSRLGTDWWRKGVVSSLSDDQRRKIEEAVGRTRSPAITDLDVAGLLRLIDGCWDTVFIKVLSRDHRTWVKELQSARNDWAHKTGADLPGDRARRCLDTMCLLLERIDSTRCGQVRQVLVDVQDAIDKANKPKPSPKAAAAGPTTAARTGLPPWTQLATPHTDVAKGKYRQSEFAASLADVVRGKATPEYQQPREFFTRTFLTEGLQQVLLAAAERITGKGGEPVVQLKTAFGGGKTHTMLALYHLIREGKNASKLAGLGELLERGGIGTLPKAQVATLVGTDITPAEPKPHPNLKPGTRVATLWGDLAAQLGGDKGYARMAAADKSGTAPGAEDISSLLDEFGPCLILIDELLVFLRQLYQASLLPCGSFDANMSFVQNLTEGVKRSKASLVVASIPASNIEIGDEGGAEALDRIQNTFGRLEAVWKPVGADEGFEIVRRRLFEPIQVTEERDRVVDAYMRLYHQAASEFPSECRESRYRARMIAGYPIHPEVFDRLYNDWSSLERFQKTRGVLRLMATTIHRLWMQKDASLLIMPGSIPLGLDPVRNEMTRYLPEGWNAIVDGDVDGERSIPYKIDQENSRLGQIQAARRVARAIFLGSAPKVRDQTIRGIDDVRIRLGVVQPEETTATYGDALNRLRDQLTHLYQNQRSYWFDQQPNLRRVVQDRATSMTSDEVAIEIDRRLHAERRGAFRSIRVALPSSEIEDETQVALVVLGIQHGHRSGSTDSAAFAEARQVLENRGASPRVHRNMLVFVAPDASLAKTLDQEVRMYLAWSSVKKEAEVLNLDALQQKEASDQQKRSDETVEAQIRETWCWLLTPTQEGTGPIQLDVSKIAGKDSDLASKAFSKLKKDGRLLTEWGPQLLKMELDRWLWKDRTHIPVTEVWRCLTSYPYLQRLADWNVLSKTISEGVRAEDFFGYARAVDPSGKFLGLELGRAGIDPKLESSPVLVKPEVAKAQIEEARAKVAAGTTSTPPRSPGGSSHSPSNTTGSAAISSVPPAPPPKPTRFFARFNLDGPRMGTKAADIQKEIVQLLQAHPSARVTISLEIQAEDDEGFDDKTRRDVTENTRTLGATDSAFERS